VPQLKIVKMIPVLMLPKEVTITADQMSLITVATTQVLRIAQTIAVQMAQKEEMETLATQETPETLVLTKLVTILEIQVIQEIPEIRVTDHQAEMMLAKTLETLAILEIPEMDHLAVMMLAKILEIQVQMHQKVETMEEIAVMIGSITGHGMMIVDVSLHKHLQYLKHLQKTFQNVQLPLLLLKNV
jgi:hypothetical protein